MSIPGFRAEASVRRSAGCYTSRAPRAAADDRIVPMWTEEERQLLIMCGQRYDSCESECAVFTEYPQWQDCNIACNQQYDECAAPVLWPSNR
ncbi:hypothetical protein [Embleya sp. NPDC050493]|uniref:hypothetical protein n=1 Tax=Embleya sp. NPDC050493 TaxID=3363989 RepID=UPI0037B0B988